MEFVTFSRDCQGAVVRPSLSLSRLKEAKSIYIVLCFVTVGCNQDICRLSAGWSKCNCIFASMYFNCSPYMVKNPKHLNAHLANGAGKEKLTATYKTSCGQSCSQG